MAELDTTRSFNDGEVLVEADLDAFLDDIETFLNVTKINDDNIQNNGITGSTKLLNQSVTETKLAANAVTTLKIADDAVTNAKLADDAVTTDKIVDANVTTVKIADANVTTAKILDANVTTAKLALDSVTADILKDSSGTDADRAVTSDHIRDSAITTAKINDNAITRVKINPYYATNTISTDSSVTNGEVKSLGSLTVTGRPVRISIFEGVIRYVRSTGTFTNVLTLQYSSDNSSWSDLPIVAYRVSASTDRYVAFSEHGSWMSAGATAGDPASPFVYTHTPSAGTAYYRLNPSITSGTGTVSIEVAIKSLIEEL